MPADAAEYLFRDSKGGPQRHGESFTVTTNVVSVVEDAVLSTKHDCWSAMRKVLTVYEIKNSKKQCFNAYANICMPLLK